MAAGEARTGKISTRAETLVAPLRREFEVVQQRLRALEHEMRELRQALEALQDGGAGAAGRAQPSPHPH